MKTKKEYLKEGYTVVHSDKEYLTLERPKKFSLGWFITVGLITGGLGFIVYPLYYIGKSNDRVTLEKRNI